MYSFTVIFFCIQTFLIQNAFSQCTSRAAVAAEPGLGRVPYGLGAPFAYEGLAGWGGMAPAAAIGAPFGRVGLGELAYPGAAGLAAPLGAIAPYGGAGEGNVAVAGELPVAGSTAVAGQVPIMGAVNFGGAVPAAGAVSIAGQCACGCGASYNYPY